MKQTTKITFCAICSALSVVFMLLGYFPYLTYAVPAISGLVCMLPIIEINKKYAFATYVVSSMLVLITAEPETKVLYLVIFGYYPILKAIIEKINNRVLEMTVKTVYFNLAVAVIYLLLKFLTTVDVDDFGAFGRYGAVAFVILCNIAFVMYDIAISRLAYVYMAKIHPKISSVIK